MDNSNSKDHNRTKQFLTLFAHNKDRIHAYILYCVPNVNDAEDLLQDTSVVLLERFGEYQENTNFLAWAIQIAKFKILAFRHKNKNSRLIFNDADLAIADHQDLTNRFDIMDEQFSALRSCLKELSSKHKQLLQYRYEYDMSFRGIAKQFNVSMQAIYKSISRIHVFLLKCTQLRLNEKI